MTGLFLGVKINNLKVPKCEIFDRSDFHDLYTTKPFWVGDFGANIKTCYFGFGGASII